jgi:AcrR family transcriptional regulator
MPRRKRLSRDERRKQIVTVTLDQVAENGVRGTTLSKIAAAIPDTPPALYTHFRNRRDIHLATIDELFERRTLPHRYPLEGNAIERLRSLGHRHTELVSADNDKSVFALFEFIAAPPEEGLRETMGAKILLLVDDIASIVREGQAEGTVRKDADPPQVAWMIVSRAWTEDITHLLGVGKEWNEERSDRMLELILDSIAADPQDVAPA